MATRRQSGAVFSELMTADEPKVDAFVDQRILATTWRRLPIADASRGGGARPQYRAAGASNQVQGARPEIERRKDVFVERLGSRRGP
jgi:hypothetical protein